MIDKTTQVFGKIVCKYTIPLDQIEDFNNVYDQHKEELISNSARLVGRLESELEITHLLPKTKIFSNLAACMDDYIETWYKTGEGLRNPPEQHLKRKFDILSCWMNDMVEREYNPPHTHYDGTGWSTVLFLKVPEFVNEGGLKGQLHKFRDGQLGFISVDGTNTLWVEPRVGDFYIFEAIHQHCVMPFKTKNKQDIRRSMSFNFLMEKAEDV